MPDPRPADRDPNRLILDERPALARALRRAAELHAHVCPRQVLGARMAGAAGAALGLTLPQGHDEKRLLAIVEHDGCFSDGVAAAANCWLGRRTMRVEDEGKIAATFVDTETERALRVRPRLDVRERVAAAAPGAASRWEAYVLAYQRLPDEELLELRPVRLAQSVDKIVSHPARRVVCEVCGEEVSNERELIVDGRPRCRRCAGFAYWAPLDEGPHAADAPGEAGAPGAPGAPAAPAAPDAAAAATDASAPWDAARAPGAATP